MASGTKLTTTAETAVRAVIDDWVEALRAKDADGVVAHQSDDFRQFALAPPLQQEGSDRDALAAWFGGWDGPLGYELHDHRVVVGDAVAVSHSLNHLRATATDGTRSDLWFRQTICLERAGGDWKITHEHESVPLAMDGSGRAEVALEP
jgi:PhnB protein